MGRRFVLILGVALGCRPGDRFHGLSGNYWEI